MNITSPIEEIKEQASFPLDEDAVSRYYTESRQRKNLFALIVIGKNTASLCFRVNPDTSDENNVRTVKGFFFPIGTEYNYF